MHRDHRYVAMSLRNFGRACRQTWRWDEFSERLKQFFTCLQPGALRIMSGQVIDRTPAADAAAAAQTAGTSMARVPAAVAAALACFRFLNCEFYFTERELRHLMGALSIAEIGRRQRFFEESLRRRRRERNLWGGTPLAKVFTESEAGEAAPRGCVYGDQD